MSLLRARKYAPSDTRARESATRIPPGLASSEVGRESAEAIDLLLRERSAEHREFWIAVVPGCSEEWGHHRAPPRAAEQRGQHVSAEFATRLHRGYRLLEREIVRFLLISGGAVDPARPDYNEALRGRDWLLGRFAKRWPLERGPLARRILVDPLALHSTTNLRNADKLCADLGIDRVLIATTMPPTPYLWPALVPVLYQTNQGWYFLHHRVSTFDWRCRRELGYTLGRFDWFEVRDGAARLTAIAHHGWNLARLKADTYGP